MKTKVIYGDKCEHKHNDNSKKRKYKYCEDCGAQRFYMETNKLELYHALENRLVYAGVVDKKTDEIQRKYYAVLEWYEGDYKICYQQLKELPDAYDEFKLFLEDYDVWKLKRFGLFVIQDPVPTQAFYKNMSLKNVKYGKLATLVDPDINKTKKDIISKISKNAEDLQMESDVDSDDLDDCDLKTPAAPEKKITKVQKTKKIEEESDDTPTQKSKNNGWGVASKKLPVTHPANPDHPINKKQITAIPKGTTRSQRV